MKVITSLLVLVILSSFFCIETRGQIKPKLLGSTWNEVLENGNGELVFYWYGSDPLIYMKNGNLSGIEYEIANSFKQYIEEQYQVSLTSRWMDAPKFEGIVERIGKAKGGVFGMSGISITESRKAIVQFTPPHLSDICVIASSANVPVENTVTGFIKSVEGLTALTIKGSTFEHQLLQIQKEHNIALKFKYIESTSDLIERLKNIEDAFGYVDLRSFMIDLNKGSSIRRQYFYPMKLPGLSFAYPKDSDWNIPVEAYFKSQQFQEDKNRIHKKYLGKDIIELIERIDLSADIGAEEEVIILTKERELQYQELLDKTLQMKKDQKLMNLMLLVILIVVVLATIFYTRYRMKLAANLLLARKQAEIESKNIQLTDLNNEKDHLIGLLAHDLRAPVARIIGIAQMMKNDSEHQTPEMLDHINKDAHKLDALITKILDVEAIENHRHNLNIVDVDAIEVIKELIDDYATQASAKKIKIETNFTGDKIMLKADKVYLSQALENLLSNALKFSNPGTTVRFEIDDQNVIHIKDQGPGFTDEDKQKVFKKFQRLSARPTGGEQSTGLGMITVRLFIELMDGEVSFDSKEGEGTTFHVRLPQPN